MSSNTSITCDQLSTLFWGAELGGNTALANHFSYAEKGRSTYSFGVPQFDVGNDDHAQKFLKENGFSDRDIGKLSTQGGLSPTELNALDAKLQAIPQAKIDQLTEQHLTHLIGNVGGVIDQVRKQNPAAADAISNDQQLQLSIADYENQFGSVGPQLVGFLAGNPEKLQGGTVQSGNPPTRGDLLNFVHSTAYGRNPHNAKAIESRNERFDEAMSTLKPGHAAHTAPNHTPNTMDHALRQGAHGPAVHNLQTQLAGLGYLNTKGIDGHFGIHTRHAVELFQHDHHLTVDGKVGPLTAHAMQAALHERTTAPSLTEARHPDHALFAQALAGVHALDAQHGRASDAHSLNLAAALTVEAKREGLTRIDQLAPGKDANRIHAMQNADSPWTLPKWASVDTMTALHTPITQSSAMAAAAQPPQPAPPEIPAVTRSQAISL